MRQYAIQLHKNVGCAVVDTRNESDVKGKGDAADRFGAVASSLCALHCAICAMAPALFGAIGLGVLLSPAVENGLALVAILFAAFAMLIAWRQKRSTLILSLLALGVLGLILSRGLEMGGHHDHHAEAHHAEVSEGDEHEGKDEHEGRDEHEGKDERPEDEHAEGHHEAHEGGDMTHALGGAVGVLAGLTLLTGHLLNLDAARKRREDEGWS